MTKNWSDITLEALQKTWEGFLMFLPKIIGALIFFTIGLFLSSAFGKLISEVLRRLNFDKIFERTGWKEALEKADLKVSPSDFIGGVCKWILVIVSLSVSVRILDFTGFSDILSVLISWIPNLIVAVAIFVVAIILTDILEKIIKASIKKMGIGYAGMLGAVIRWAIYIIAILAVLDQLNVAPTIINTLFTGIVGMFSLAFGLAFGLGGKDAAAKMIEELKKKLS